jgi:multicomponent Na+:H+ antiporter subunit D
MQQPRSTRVLVWLAWLLSLGIGWFLFAGQISGSETAVSVAGISPTLLLVARVALFLRPSPAAGQSTLPRLATLLVPLRRLHSGHIGDYVAWLTLGVAAFGAIFALLLR